MVTSSRSPVSLLLLLILSTVVLVLGTEEEDDKVSRIPTQCEVCRVLVNEMDAKMKETFKKTTLDVSSKPFSPDSRKIDYSRSEISFSWIGKISFEAVYISANDKQNFELRLLEVLDSVCAKVADYRVHSKEGMQRYAKQESETIDTLNSLRKRGVKVDIGIPWSVVDEQPNKEIMALKRKCEALVEDYEDNLSAWYFQKQDQPLIDYFCRETVLKGEDQSCLSQPWEPFGLPYSDGSGTEKKTETEQPTRKKEEL